MSLEKVIAADEALTKIFTTPTWPFYARMVYEKATGRFRRMVRYVKVILTRRRDYKNPDRPGHELEVEITLSKTVPVDREDEAKAELAEMIDEAIAAEGLPVIGEVDDQWDYEEAAAEEELTIEKVDWSH